MSVNRGNFPSLYEYNWVTDRAIYRDVRYKKESFCNYINTQGVRWIVPLGARDPEAEAEDRGGGPQEEIRVLDYDRDKSDDVICMENELQSLARISICEMLPPLVPETEGPFLIFRPSTNETFNTLHSKLSFFKNSTSIQKFKNKISRLFSSLWAMDLAESLAEIRFKVNHRLLLPMSDFHFKRHTVEHLHISNELPMSFYIAMYYDIYHTKVKFLKRKKIFHQGQDELIQELIEESKKKNQDQSHALTHDPLEGPTNAWLENRNKDYFNRFDQYLDEFNSSYSDDLSNEEYYG